MSKHLKQKLQSKLLEIEGKIKEKNINIKNLELFKIDINNSFKESIKELEEKYNIFKALKDNKKHLKLWKIKLHKTIFPIQLKHLISMPIIYGMIIPSVLFHLALEIYHQTCFRLYGIPLVKPKDYFVYDRRLLPYLNWIEKLNCAYCSYFNNLIRYAAEIGGRTERYWCPIKYAHRLEQTHSQYDKFVGYLEAEEFRKKWQELRKFSELKDKN